MFKTRVRKIAYRKYFDVEEEEVFERIKSALVLRPSFHQVLGNKPDLFGPFWIATTLVVILIVSSSLLWFINGQIESYNYNFLPVAAIMVLILSIQIFGITFLCPYLISILVKVFGGKMPVVRVSSHFTQLICIYGYSMVAFMIPTVFCFIKSHVFQTIVLGFGFCLSLAFLIINVLR